MGMIDPETCNLDTLTWIHRMADTGDELIYCAEYSITTWVHNSIHDEEVRVPFYYLPVTVSGNQYTVRTIDQISKDGSAWSKYYGSYDTEDEAKRALLAAYIEGCQQIIEEKMS